MNSCAMSATRVKHTDLVQHQVGIVKQFREFWMKDHLCDVVLRSRDGAEHRAHAALLSAASKFFKNLLGGSFLEADRVQQGQPVEIAASAAAVSALLDYIYGGQPEVNLEAGLELLRLAEAYDLPKLASVIEAGFCASLNSTWPPCSEGCMWREGCKGFSDLQPAPRLWKAEFWSAGPNFEKRRFVCVSGGSGVEGFI